MKQYKDLSDRDKRIYDAATIAYGIAVIAYNDAANRAVIAHKAADAAIVARANAAKKIRKLLSG